MLLTPLILAFAPASDWFVDVNATAPGAGTAALPYASIEYAIAQPGTLAGDRILVAPGIYTGETVDFLGKELTIEAEQGPGTVTVKGPLIGTTPHAPGSSGQALIRVVSGEGSGTQIIGIDFTKGAGEDRGADAVGGVLYMQGSHLELIDCHVQGEASTKGGAVFVENSTFRGTRTSFAGVVRTPEPPISPNQFFQAGGAFWAVSCDISLVDCELDSGVYVPSNYPRSVHGYLMWLEDCATAITTSDLSLEGACLSHCQATSLIHTSGGTLSLDSCGWLPSLGGGHRHTIWAENAALSIQNIVASPGSRIIPGRFLLASNCDSIIRNCTLHDSLGAIADVQPFSPEPGGLISHDGTLLIEDCTFRNNGHVSGGAIYATNLIVRNSIFEDNISKPGWTAVEGRGGAIVADTATIENCNFIGNWVPSATSSLDSFYTYPTMGGALYLTGPSTVRNCNFVNNRAGVNLDYTHFARGGAIYAEAPVRIFDCVFTDNLAALPNNSSTGCYVQGGALFLEQGGYLENCILSGNTVDAYIGLFSPPHPIFTEGGALYVEAGPLSLVNCIIEGNQAEIGAGILAGAQVQASIESTFLRNNTLVEIAQSPESSTGAAWFGPIDATRCTITQHDALTVAGDVTAGGSLDSCIFWNNAPASLPAGVTATYSTIEGLAPGLGNTTEDPLFWSTDDVRLLPASPAIDSGNSALFDADGTRSDRGAFPFDAAYCGVLCAVPLGTEPCASNPNSLGLTADIAAYGSATVSDQFLTLTTTQVPEGAFGYYLASESGGFVPLFAGSQGNLCLGGTLYRMHDALLQANSGQRVGRRVDLNDLAYGNVVLPGSTWHFQLWYRDSGFVPSTTNTSGSVQIQF